MMFNKEFDEVFQRKEQEIVKIKEKNKRIRKIIEDLGLQDDVFEPEMGVIEKPEMLLTTTDDEVINIYQEMIMIYRFGWLFI